MSIPPDSLGQMPSGASTDLALPEGAGALIAALRQGGGTLDIPAPLSEPILIMERARVASTQFVEDIDEVCEGLREGERLTFVRDSANLASRWSVRVVDARGRDVGRFPADGVEIVARLMDGGKNLFGRVASVSVVGRRHRVEMEVFLDD